MNTKQQDPWWSEFDEYAKTAFPCALDGFQLELAHAARKVGLSPSAAIVAIQTTFPMRRDCKAA